MSDAASAKKMLDNSWLVMAADITRDGTYGAFDALALDLFLSGYMELEQKIV